MNYSKSDVTIDVEGKSFSYPVYDVEGIYDNLVPESFAKILLSQLDENKANVGQLLTSMKEAHVDEIMAYVGDLSAENREKLIAKGKQALKGRKK